MSERIGDTQISTWSIKVGKSRIRPTSFCKVFADSPPVLTQTCADLGVCLVKYCSTQPLLVNNPGKCVQN